jgi:chemotaxis protein methyltransferase CheR
VAALRRATLDLETDLLLDALFRGFGFDFRGYDRVALGRKLHVLMRDRSLATVSRLQDRVLHDPVTRAAVLRSLAVAPVPLFDDPRQARQLRAVLSSSLRTSALPRVWLAECGGVEEAWSLAILLADEQLHARTDVFATVSNDEVLAEVGGAGISIERMAQYQENYLKSGGTANLAEHFDLQGKRAVLKGHLRERITWAQYNLVTDASFNEFQLIVCRRALADFGPVLRQATLKLFHESLSLFGVLGLDRELDDSDALHASYAQLFAHQPWYKRIA